MDKTLEKYKLLRLTYQCFYEPDFKNKRTAIAFEPIDSTLAKRLFSSFELL